MTSFGLIPCMVRIAVCSILQCLLLPLNECQQTTNTINGGLCKRTTEYLEHMLRLNWVMDQMWLDSRQQRPLIVKVTHLSFTHPVLKLQNGGLVT